MGNHTGVSPKSPNKYLGPNVYLTLSVTRNRAPTSADVIQPETGKYYPFGSIWVIAKDPTTGAQGDIYLLSKIVANQSYWVLISSGGSNVDSFQVDASTAPGTNPVTPTIGGLITVTGGQITNAGLANVIRTNSLSANTYTIQIQQAGLSASTDATKNGVAHFNSTHFTEGANAFISSQVASTSQIGVVTLATQAQHEYNTYGTTQVLQSQFIAAMMAKPAPIGSTTANTGAFTTCTATGALEQFIVLSSYITTANTSSTNTGYRSYYRCTTAPSAGFGNTIEFFMTNSAVVDAEYAQILAVIDSPTAGAETGHFRIDVNVAGVSQPTCRFYGDRVELFTGSRLRLGSGGVDFLSGTGDPNTVVTAAKGSYYARLDGSSSTTRAYINTDGVTAWTSVTTAT